MSKIDIAEKLDNKEIEKDTQIAEEQAYELSADQQPANGVRVTSGLTAGMLAAAWTTGD